MSARILQQIHRRQRIEELEITIEEHEKALARLETIHANLLTLRDNTAADGACTIQLNQKIKLNAMIAESAKQHLANKYSMLSRLREDALVLDTSPQKSG